MVHPIVIRSGWQLWSSVLLHRLPIVSATHTPLEAQMASLMRMREDENSLLSRHELRHRDDLKKAAALKESGEATKVKQVQQKSGGEEAVLLTAHEQGLLWQREAAAHVAADRNSPASAAKLDSISRQLERVLVLLERSTAQGCEEPSNAATWRLPAAPLLSNDESLVDPANRVLAQLQAEEGANSPAALRLLGNAPWAVYTYNYGGVKGDVGVGDCRGVKMFVYKAVIMDARRSLAAVTADAAKATVRPSNVGVQQSAWVTRDELLDLAPYSCQRYARFVRKCISEY